MTDTLDNKIDDELKYSYWFTEEDTQLYGREHAYIHTYDRKNNRWPALLPMVFKPEVLDRYKTHEYCTLDMSDPSHGILAFLNRKKKPWKMDTGPAADA